MLMLAGCAAPNGPQTGSSGGYASSSSYRASLERARSERDERKRRLNEAGLQDEVDVIAKEIYELELRISELERQVEDAERKESSAASSARASGCYTGPRGGRYTITSSGKKNYGGC